MSELFVSEVIALLSHPNFDLRTEISQQPSRSHRGTLSTSRQNALFCAFVSQAVTQVIKYFSCKIAILIFII